MTALAQRLEAIRKAMARRGLELNATATEDDVAALEREAGIILPDAYRAFLLLVGDGGKGPPAFGIDSIDQLADEYAWDRETTFAILARKFPYAKDLVWDEMDAAPDEDADDFEGQSDSPTAGFLPLGTDGCGAFYGLVVTGPERGNVWLIDSNGVFRQGEFIEWLEDWLGIKRDNAPTGLAN